MRNASATISQMTNSARPSCHDSANAMPAAVDTPLPPAKWWNTGYRWPTYTASAAPAVASEASPQLAPRRLATHTATKPLTPSPSRVSAAAALLPVRSTLVAPGLPEP